MDMELVNRFDATGRTALTALWSMNNPQSYDDIFTELCKVLKHAGYPSGPDPERITVIDHGECQGTRVFVVGESGYQPSTYWIACVSYGSCSGCDTFERISEYSDTVTPEKTAEYVTLALHMLQSMRRVG